MPEIQKDKKRKGPKEGSAAEDQRERGYYYDDAHGYEEYDPEKEDDESDRDESPNGLAT